MKKLDLNGVIGLAAWGSDSWIVTVCGLDRHPVDSVLAALPWLTLDGNDCDTQAISDGRIFVLFGNEKSARDFMNSIPSDDNPPAAGDAAFYAFLTDRSGAIVDETS